jgi:transketolase
MRATLDKFLSKYNNPNLYFLHADMWSFPLFRKRFPEQCLNFGIQETNMVNVAGGLASQGKKVIIYGVAGFVYQRGYEQLKFSVANFGRDVTLVNAGHNGCYSKCGIGHLPDDDYRLMDALGVRCHEPEDRYTFLQTLIKCIRDDETNFIRLGWDNREWKINRS